MCDFISYIECDDHICYLTDKDVYSKEGKKLLEGCRDNDLLGHGAIRKYFYLNPTQGKRYEHRDFWNKEKFPKEIADKIDNFDKYWGKMLKNCLTESDKDYIFKNAPIGFINKLKKILGIKSIDDISIDDILIKGENCTIDEIRKIRKKNANGWKGQEKFTLKYADKIAEITLNVHYNKRIPIDEIDMCDIDDLRWIIQNSPKFRIEALNIVMGLTAEINLSDTERVEFQHMHNATQIADLLGSIHYYYDDIVPKDYVNKAKEILIYLFCRKCINEKDLIIDENKTEFCTFCRFDNKYNIHFWYNKSKGISISK
jgi:hypothetical protein